MHASNNLSPSIYLLSALSVCVSISIYLSVCPSAWLTSLNIAHTLTLHTNRYTVFFALLITPDSLLWLILHS